MIKAVKIIAILATVLSILYFIAACILLVICRIGWLDFVVTNFSLAISLTLLWALYEAFRRIEILEVLVHEQKDKMLATDTNNKLYKVLTSSSSKNKETVSASDKPFKQCKACGAVERTNAKCCPMCNTPYEESINEKKLTK